MSNFARLAAALLALLFLAACASTRSAPPERAPVILVSIDGFRPDYLDRGLTPNLSRLREEGVFGAMRPSFPSKTFPNHLTLVTGRRPDRHGMVDNNMEDPTIPGVRFTQSNRAAVEDPRWWADSMPIWVTAERAGLRTATMYWPGSEAPIQDVRPSQWRIYDKKVTPEQRVDQVLAWLDLPQPQTPAFLTLYFEAVDTAGHDFGPTSPEVNQAIAQTDAAIGRLLEGLDRRGVRPNLIIVSDHGMAPISTERRIYLDDFMDPKAVRTMTMGAFMSAYPQPGREAEVERALMQPREHMTCWRKGEIPAVHGYGTHRRTPPYFCLMETGWEVTTRKWAAEHEPDHGAHGFDPRDPTMRATFLAAGPAFRKGARPPLFDNVDVYPLLARLLGVDPAPNDGDLVELGPVLSH